MDNVAEEQAGTESGDKKIEKDDKNVTMADPQNMGDHSSTVAKHYNDLKEQGLEKRTQSRIFYLRNFNNWIKSMLINSTMNDIKAGKKRGDKLVVKDLCCGKGGDLLKWRKGNIHHLICADIAGTSVEQCMSRYEETAKKCNNRLFTAEFITADCTKARLKDYLRDPEIKCDLVSCQFSFHYCFESYAQADMMLRNASENLSPGGYFIGTTPDAYTLINRLQASDTNSFGNDVYRITFPEGNKSDFPLFGARYDFHLEGVVDCPEFLVYFPAFVKLAQKHDLQLVHKMTFSQFYTKHSQTREGRQLLEKMSALEPYPNEQLVGEPEKDYEHAKQYLQQHSHNRNERIGTLSQSEWEATSLYCVFVFVKLSKESITSSSIIAASTTDNPLPNTSHVTPTDNQSTTAETHSTNETESPNKTESTNENLASSGTQSPAENSNQ